MVRPIDTPRRPEEGNPIINNVRENPNNNGRPRNNLRYERLTRRSLEPVNEIIRHGVITRQMRLQIQMQRHLHGPQTENIEHNSMMMASQNGGVPTNQRRTGNRLRPPFTRARPLAGREPVPTTSRVPEIPASPETSPRPVLRLNTAPASQDPIPGPSQQFGTASTSGTTRSTTPQPNTGVATRSSTRYRPYQRPVRRIVQPPYWRPDLVHESSSEDENAINRQQEEEQRLSSYIATHRIPLPVSIERPYRAINTIQDNNGRMLHIPGGNIERNASRNESQLPAWMRPRRDGSLRVEDEEDFVPAGYFPNLTRAGSTAQPAGTNIRSSNMPAHIVERTRISPLQQSSNDQQLRPNIMPSAMTSEASTSTGRRYSRKNPSVGKCPRDLQNARDIPKELRENIRAFTNERRKSARLQRRGISSDESDEDNQAHDSSAESSDVCQTTDSESNYSSSHESVQSIRVVSNSSQHVQDNSVQPAATNKRSTNKPADDDHGKSSAAPLPCVSNDQQVATNIMSTVMTIEPSTSTGHNLRSKNPSRVKHHSNFQKARDITKEVRENLRAQTNDRRKSARLQARGINSDQSDEDNQASDISAESSDVCQTTSSKSNYSSSHESVLSIRVESNGSQHGQDNNVQPAATNTRSTNMPADDDHDRSNAAPSHRLSNDQQGLTNIMPTVMTSEPSTSSGLKFRSKKPSKVKHHPNFQKARDIPKEVRENIHAQTNNRRKSARLQARGISSDQSDEGNQASDSSASCQTTGSENNSSQPGQDNNVQPVDTSTRSTDMPANDDHGKSSAAPLPSLSNDQLVATNIMSTVMNSEPSTSTGLKFRSKNPSRVKHHPNFQKARDIPKEVRESIHSQTNDRRKSARLKARGISGDQSKEGTQTSKSSSEISIKCHTTSKESIKSASTEIAQSTSRESVD